MKKILLGILLVMIVPFMVHAAQVPYVWIVNGEEISASGSSNASGTATITKEGNVVTLTLNNYQGGFLREECRGTGVEDVEFKIVLNGKNVVNSDKIGIELEDSSKKITFEGTGTLQIIAPTPISNEDYTIEAIIDPSNPLKEEEEEILVSENEEDLLIAEQEKPNIVIPIVAGIVALIIICGLVFAIVKGKKKTEEKPL